MQPSGRILTMPDETGPAEGTGRGHTRNPAREERSARRCGESHVAAKGGKAGRRCKEVETLLCCGPGSSGQHLGGSNNIVSGQPRWCGGVSFTPAAGLSQRSRRDIGGVRTSFQRRAPPISLVASRSPRVPTRSGHVREHQGGSQIATLQQPLSTPIVTRTCESHHSLAPR